MRDIYNFNLRVKISAKCNEIYFSRRALLSKPILKAFFCRVRTIWVAMCAIIVLWFDKNWCLIYTCRSFYLVTMVVIKRRPYQIKLLTERSKCYISWLLTTTYCTKITLTLMMQYDLKIDKTYYSPLIKLNASAHKQS